MFTGSCIGQALSLDGVTCLRLVLPSPRYFGVMRQRDVSFHDNVGEYIHLMSFLTSKVTSTTRSPATKPRL